MDKLDKILYELQNRTLDLSSKNNLINLKRTKSVIEIIRPNTKDLLDSLFDGKKLNFPYINEFKENDKVFIDYSNPKSLKTSFEDGLQLMRSLRTLRKKQKLIQQEKGLNSLYLAVGFLKWFDTSYSNIENYSPILLVPIKLINNKITDPFSIEIDSEEITINPALLIRLKKDFGIEIKESFDGSYLDLLKLFKNLCLNTNWKVEDKAYLGIFSFLKISIYNDYKKNINSFKSNPIISKIYGDELIDDYFEYDFDSLKVKDNPLTIFDADSSQLEAIANANNGLSFVLQGPPGTGKSQTISNIIANSISNGKKVLFVSEKKAALDIVLKKMKEADLDEFCLNLHDVKSNRKSVLDDFQRVLNESKKSYILSSQVSLNEYNLEYSRDQLKEYCNLIHTPIKPLELSLFDAYSKIAELDSIPYLEFSIEDIDKISEQEYINIINSVNNFSVSKQRLSRDIENNPWNIYKHKNNYSIDLEYKFNEANKKINYYIEKYNNMIFDINEKFGYKINNVKDFEILYQNVKIISSVDSIPKYWIYNFNYELFINQIDSTQNSFNKYKTTLNNYLNKQISFYPSILDSSLESIDNAIFELNNRINKEYLYSYWKNIKTINSLDNDFVNECIAKQKEILRLENEINTSFTKAIYNTDYDLYLSRMLHDYSNIFNRLSNRYRKDLNYFKSLCINDIPLKRKNIIELLKKLRLIGTLKNWFISKEKILIDLLGNEYKSYNSNFESLVKYFEHYCIINDGINELYKLKSELIDFNSSNENFTKIFDVDYLLIKDNCKDIINKLNIINKFKSVTGDLFSLILEGYYEDLDKKICITNLLNSFEEFYSCLNNIYKWFVDNFEYSIEFEQSDFNFIKTSINNCYESFDLLREADAYDDALQKCIKYGLANFISYSQHVTPSLLIDVFNKRFYMCWIEKILTLDPYSKIRNFDSLKHDDIVNLFRKLDRESIKMNRSIVKFNIFNNMPPYIKNNTHYGEINILQKEISKSKNHKPLRVLFNSISSILQTLKPCMMMSPQTVSTYLDFDIFKFDLIIFDEASQVFVENSLPAIARGKQLIIAGDSKQLPPTNFFNVLSDDEYIESDESYNEIGESILEEFDKLPSLTLKWHYRSKNESLISFSNQSFYRNALYTFPSVIINKKDNGVEFIHCENGRYDRGGKSGNKEEAKKIANLVLEHLKTNPDRSLGIISFGSVQQEAIEFEINKLRYDYPEFEFFFDEEKPEYFFIKNLETVQGDERDTIIISVGYGKDLNGQFNLNFGPLNQLGGERRLNVAITRAKINCKVVSSFLPSELNADKCKNIGPKYLKQYLEFIMNNDFPNIYSSNDFDSSFEENVFDFLVENNYEVDSQVGCSGYKIDIAVKDNYGNYCLGIECDGMTYHRARTTRDRDRLRHDVLTGLGWKLHRIWSTDWIRNNKFEKQRLLDAIANSNVISKNTDNFNISDDNNFIITKEKDLLDDLQYYGFDINTNIEENLVASLKYESKENIILKIIDAYYPIHEDLLRKLFCQIYFGYTNQKSYREFNAQLYILLSNKRILRHGQFYYPRYFTNITPRIPNIRKMTQISYVEIAYAMKTVLEKCDMTFEELSKEVARLYGFLIGYNQIVAKLMNDAYDFVINNKKIKIIYDSIVVL